MSLVSIYGLVDPRTDSIRYIGKTKYKIKYRFKNHLKNTVDDCRYPVHYWIRSLLRKGLKPQLILVAKVSEAFWEEAERICISCLRRWGYKIKNLAGGVGVCITQINQSEISCARLF